MSNNGKGAAVVDTGFTMVEEQKFEVTAREDFEETNVLHGGILAYEGSVVSTQLEAANNGGPGIMASIGVRLFTATHSFNISQNAASGVISENDQISLEHVGPILRQEGLVHQFVGNAGHGLTAVGESGVDETSFGATTSLDIDGSINASNNAGWGVQAKHAIDIGREVNANFFPKPSTISNNGFAEEVVVYDVISRNPPFEVITRGEMESKGKHQGGLISGFGSVLVAHLHSTGNNGPGVFAAQNVQLASQVLPTKINDNRGPGVIAVNGGVGIIDVSGPTDIGAVHEVLRNGGNGLEAGSRFNDGDGNDGFLDGDPFTSDSSLVIEDAINISGNAGWGIHSAEGVHVGGIEGISSVSSRRTIISQNGIGNEVIAFDGGAVSANPKFITNQRSTEDNDGVFYGGVFSNTNGIFLANAHVIENKGPGVLAHNNVTLKSTTHPIIVRGNRGPGVQAVTNMITIASVGHTLIHEVSSNQGDGLVSGFDTDVTIHSLPAGVSVDGPIRIEDNTGRGIHSQGAVGLGLVGENPLSTISRISNNGTGGSVFELSGNPSDDNPRFRDVSDPAKHGIEATAFIAGNVHVTENNGDGVHVAGQVNVNTGRICGNHGENIVAGGDITLTNVLSGEACDIDSDGVDDEIENAAANNGDGNNDGALDSQQDNVTSLPNAVDGQSITLTANKGQLSEVNILLDPTNGNLPTDLVAPIGFSEFKVTGIPVGESVNVELFLPDTQPIQQLLLFTPTFANPTPSFVPIDFQIDGNKVTYTLTDGQLGDADLSANGIIVDPVAPVFYRSPQIQVGAALTLDEGEPLVRTGSFQDVDSTSHSATVDYGDGAGAVTLPLNEDGTFELSHVYTDNGAFEITVTITDDDGYVGTAVLPVTVNNVDPQLSIQAPSEADIDTTIAFTLNVTDSPADLAGGITFEIDWDGDDIIDQTVTGPNGVEVIHVFEESGSFDVMITAVDKDGGVSEPAEHFIRIDAAAGGAGSAVMVGEDLVISGTQENDVIRVRQRRQTGDIYVRINGHRSGPFTPTGKILIDAKEADDDVRIPKHITLDSELTGGPGNDLLRGGSGNDLLLGGEGNDLLMAKWGDDTLKGGIGEDELRSGLGDDLLFGEDGHDTLKGHLGNDLLDGGTGNDLLRGGQGDDFLTGGVGNDTLHGSRGNDTLHGGEGDDLLLGGSGDDTILGEDGTDRLGGGSGNDSLDGGNGNDTLLGQAGDDTLYGREGDDALNGGSENDIALGGEGDDQIIGGNGRDLLIGGHGADNLKGRAQDDILIAGVTVFDEEQNSLNAIRDEWASDRSYSDRMANLLGQGCGPRKNGSIVLSTCGEHATVLNDDDSDTLRGNAGVDWFFANLDTGIIDIVKDSKANEVISEPDWACDQ